MSETNPELLIEIQNSVMTIIINRPERRNAVNLEVLSGLVQALQQAEQDKSLRAIVLTGAGEKAFCAGGDVRALYHASVAAKGQVTEVAKVFFEEEYRLDYLLHTFGKPVLVWGDGIVMGGGLGLMAGASHRVVTETSRIAMPEVTIGLYPDVGGSYFLNRMPGKMGLFLGLTQTQTVPLRVSPSWRCELIPSSPC